MRKALAAAFAAGAAGILLRRRRTPRERIDLYYEDGSIVSLAPDSVEGARILALAGDVRRSAAG